MDPEKDAELDELLSKTSMSALASVEAAIDVDQRLHDLYRELDLTAPVERCTEADR